MLSEKYSNDEVCAGLFALPGYIEISSAGSIRRIEIDADFRLWIEFELVLLNRQEMLGRLIRRIVKLDSLDGIDSEALMTGLIDFYSAEPDNAENKTSGNGTQTPQTRGNERWYDFEADFGRLTASFRAVYGIDLYTCDMHWRVFRTLMLNLPLDCEFMRVVGYRLADTDGMTKSQKQRYKRLKALYALPVLSASSSSPSMTLAERDRLMLEHMNRVREEMRE